MTPDAPVDPDTTQDPGEPGRTAHPAEAAWRTPGHTNVETALEVTGYSQATR
ncbi:pyrroloquinoline quinone precursor peptide PqqA [Streptomyces sp. NPDC004788]